MQSSNYVRLIPETEIYTGRQSVTGVAQNLPVLNLAYYPKLRGFYNYSTNVDTAGNLLNPTQNWGGIQRAISTTNFETANIEFVQFWLMSPYLEGNTQTGDLYIDLGDVSEDVLKDGRKSL